MMTAHGLHGLDHVGLTVPDLEEAIGFWTDVVGASLAFRHGPYGRHHDAVRQFGRPADSSVVGIAMMRLGATNIELLQFDSPSASDRRPRPDEAGGHHLALYVDDLDGAVQAAVDAGVTCFGEPMSLPGPESGPAARFVFLQAPWGLIVELVSYPNGKAFQTEQPELLHDPRTVPPL
jgi:glyoxylase I family protein